MVKERVIGAKEEKESMAKERVLGAKEEKEIGAKEEKDSAANREQSKERARAKEERREVNAHMNSYTEMHGIGGDNNHNGQEEARVDLIHSPNKARSHGCADFAH